MEPRHTTGIATTTYTRFYKFEWYYKYICCGNDFSNGTHGTLQFHFLTTLSQFQIRETKKGKL